MLEDYAKSNGYNNLMHFTDDGYSGGNFDRQGWKQLLRLIEEGKVAPVIVKDMRRVGRDYLQVGFYTEVFFREKVSVLLLFLMMLIVITMPAANSSLF